MKIAIITDTYHPIKDGVVRFVEMLARALRDNGHKVVVIAPTVPKRFYPDEPKHVPGIGVIRIPILPALIKDYFPTFPSLKMIRALSSCDLIVINSLSFTTVHTMLVNRFFGKPIYQFIHHDEFELAELVFGVPKPIVDAFMTIFTHMTQNVQRFGIATRKFYRKTLRFHVKPEQIFWVPFGYEKVEVQADEITAFKKSLGIPLDNQVLLYLGRFANEKNVDAIYEVLNYFSTRPNISAVMVGMGYKYPELKERAKAEESNVIFTGRLPDKYLPHIYSIADFLVTPTFHETLCFTVVEAMNYGAIPVVNGKYDEPSLDSSNCIAIRNIKDKEEIISKISAVLYDPERMKEMKQALKKVAEYHSYESFKKIWGEEVKKIEK